jgi:hypothetical protein
MKSQIMSMILTLGAIAASQTALHAQSFLTTTEVPFAFQAGGHTWEAGKYSVRRTGGGMTVLRNDTNFHSTYVAGAGSYLTGNTGPKLVFHCYNGEKCFLAEIWAQGQNGVPVPKSKSEKELIKNPRQPVDMATIAINLRNSD